MTKVSSDELESLILQEIENLDEGKWQQLKGVGGGVWGGLTSRPGQVLQGYQRGKVSSILKSAAKDIRNARKHFIKNVEGLFKLPFRQIRLNPKIADLAESWSQTLSTLESTARALEGQAQEVSYKSGGKKELSVAEPKGSQGQAPKPTKAFTGQTAAVPTAAEE